MESLQCRLILLALLIINISCFNINKSIIRRKSLSMNLIPSLIVSAIEVSEPIINSNPTSFSFWYEVYNQSVMTFINSFNSRLIGTVIGNIFAGLIFKLIFDKFNEFTRKKDDDDIKLQQQKEEKRELPSIDLLTWGKLLLCITIDLFGDASFLVPGIGYPY